MTIGSKLPSEADELLSRAAAQLRQRLETDNNCCVETILSAFPALATDSLRAVELIVMEFHLRQQRGQNPDPELWCQRFPQWRDELRLHLPGTSLSGVDGNEEETAALQTSPYAGDDRPTVVDIEVGVPALGQHEILEEIGRGGMGVVYRARDRVLDRIVALKAILSGSLASDEEVQRFYQEARAAARLRHPNIVPIYGMGLHEGQHCFTMGLFPKGSLGKHLKEYRRDIRRSVTLAAKVTRAAQAAHARGIIHRDLKPGNILLDEHREPVVSDFGLAKRLDVSATMTLPHQAIGTPAYMAPEQARGEATTASADIWAVGVILYELLTGRRPFVGDSADKVREQVLHADPLSPRRLHPDLPADLETIVLKCLAKEATRRYGSAAALADDLERWLRGDPIEARPESRWHRVHRQFRRRMGRKGVLLLLLGLMFLGAGIAGTWVPFIYLSPAAREKRRQEHVLASLQSELAKGNKVILVDRTGPPKWYRWRTMGGSVPLPDLKLRPLKLEANSGPQLLELLPDPQQSSYRLSAEVQIRQVVKRMQIGLYFFCEELTMLNGPEHCYGLFRLAATEGEAAEAELRLVGLCERDAAERHWEYEIHPPLKSPPLPLPIDPPTSPDRLEEKRWHRIEVHVTPAEVRAFCDGVPMGAIAIADEQKRIARMWLRGHAAIVPVPHFLPRGGLGLCIASGEAGLRNIVVEPLPQP